MPWMLVGLVTVAVSNGSALAQGLPEPLPGTLSGTYAVNATSGSAVFTGNSTLEGTVTLDLRFLADYLVVGGGGGGGASNGANPGGGGGGGRVIFDNAFVINTPQTFTIEVGGGGTAGRGGDVTTGSAATNGGQSRFGDVIAAGGGAGGWGGVGATEGDGAAGGSGGGAGRNANLLTTGGTAVGSLGLGSAGGTVISSGSTWGGAGGGGATAAGAAPPGTGNNFGNGGNGGQGYASTILGVSDVFGSGGGGGARGSNDTTGLAVNGAGGTNAGSGGGPGGSGVANRGGGGGGGQRQSSGGRSGGTGGTGIVVVRYQGDPVTGSSGGGAGTGSAAGYTVHEYTDVGQTSLDLSGLNLDQRLGATLSGNLAGTGDLTFAGPGRLTLTGSSSYSGSTTVTAGTLVVNGMLSDTSLVTVGAAGTLGGTGLIAAGVTVAGVVAPGNSIGTLATNDFSLSGTLAVELARFNDGSSILPVSDLVDVTGSVTLTDADLSLGLWAGSGYSTPILGDIFYLIANDGIDAISGVFTSLNGTPATLTEGSQFSWNSQQWQITYQANYTGSYGSSSLSGGNDAAIVVVPEPATFVGAATGIALLAASSIRRYRRGRR